uniref:Uncharacterized protein n=1 Tax=Zea mays TaxID=4577 RepID=C4J6V8_MAIZE|nr:unknown [Zea mays]
MGMHDEQKATDRTRQERYLPKGPHSLPANQATEAGRRQRAEHCVIADLTRPRSPRLHFAIHVALAWSPLEALGLLESLLSQRCPVLLTSHLLPAISSDLHRLESSRCRGGGGGGEDGSARAAAEQAAGGAGGRERHAAPRAARGWWGGGRPCSASVGAMRCDASEGEYEIEMEGGRRRGGEGQSERVSEW